MRIYSKLSVFEAAERRIAWLFDEFPEVVINFSGGKDSCVVLHLALAEAERRNRLPLTVHWIDQEAEWQSTVDYVERIFADPRIHARWFQMPIRIFNATSSEEPWLYVWDEAKRNLWMREKHPTAITENIYGTDRFAELFPAIIAHHYPNTPVATIGGVRAEESPARAAGLTNQSTYKWATWGTKQTPKLGHYNFYPIYDWSYKDVWKAIHSHGWPYASIYDRMYQYGYRVQDMRVSNLHHETAIKHLRFLQEIEPATWERLTHRLRGINTIKHLKKFAMEVPEERPYMFADWREYRDHLVKHLVTDPEQQQLFVKKFASLEQRYAGMGRPDMRHKVEIASILVNDFHFTKLENWEISPAVGTWRKWKRGDTIRAEYLRTNPYITGT
jgi:predicted phosphoadenosine phosphosulfate sulfurtransferase